MSLSIQVFFRQPKIWFWWTACQMLDFVRPTQNLHLIIPNLFVQVFVGIFISLHYWGNKRVEIDPWWYWANSSHLCNSLAKADIFQMTVSWWIVNRPRPELLVLYMMNYYLKQRIYRWSLERYPWQNQLRWNIRNLEGSRWFTTPHVYQLVKRQSNIHRKCIQ